jgi:hypothetical protein
MIKPIFTIQDIASSFAGFMLINFTSKLTAILSPPMTNKIQPIIRSAIMPPLDFFGLSSVGGLVGGGVNGAGSGFMVCFFVILFGARRVMPPNVES